MDIDRLLRIYQGYSLKKISALNKQQLIAQYAQCQKISDLEKSLKRELSSVNSTNRKILENQLKEEKRREEVKYYRNTAYKAKEAIELIHSTSNDNFKCFLLNLFSQPFGNILTDVKSQLDEFADKEFCDKWLSQLNNDSATAKTNAAYLNSPWHKMLVSESDYQDKIDSLKVWEKEIDDKKSAIIQPPLIHPEPRDKKFTSGCSFACIGIFVFSAIVIGVNMSDGATLLDLIFFVVVAVLAVVGFTTSRIRVSKEKKHWVDNYDNYVATIQQKNAEKQSEYDDKMDEFRIDEDNLSKAKAEMNDHPYQIAISEVKSIIPTWQSTVDQISALLPKVEEEKEEEKIDPLLKDAALFVAKGYAASTSSLQRKFSIGYNRAGAIMSKLEELKIVGPENGRKPREVLVDYNTARRIVEKL
jgi:hypothetical protein